MELNMENELLKEIDLLNSSKTNTIKNSIINYVENSKISKIQKISKNGKISKNEKNNIFDEIYKEVKKELKITKNILFKTNSFNLVKKKENSILGEKKNLGEKNFFENFGNLENFEILQKSAVFENKKKIDLKKNNSFVTILKYDKFSDFEYIEDLNESFALTKKMNGMKKSKKIFLEENLDFENKENLEINYENGKKKEISKNLKNENFENKEILENEEILKNEKILENEIKEENQELLKNEEILENEKILKNKNFEKKNFLEKKIEKKNYDFLKEEYIKIKNDYKIQRQQHLILKEKIEMRREDEKSKKMKNILKGIFLFKKMKKNFSLKKKKKIFLKFKKIFRKKKN